MEQFITIELFGENYKFKCESNITDPGKIAELVTDEILKVEQETERESKRISRFTQLLIATLNISDKYLKLKTDYDMLSEKVSERSASIISSIENNLQ